MPFSSPQGKLRTRSRCRLSTWNKFYPSVLKSERVLHYINLDFKGKGDNLLKEGIVVQTLWAITTEERKSWYLTLSALYYVKPFLTHNWEETAANKWPYCCGHFRTSFLSAPSTAAIPNQACWITRALLAAPLWVSCCSTAVSWLPKAHLLPTAPAATHKLIPGTRWELAPAPCNCCFRASGEASVLVPPHSLA